MDRNDLENAIRQLCDSFDWPAPVQILIVGGAASVLTRLLPEGRVTGDVDVISYSPADAMGRVELTADVVGKILGLPPNWLNSDVQLRSDTLPEGWESRRVLVASGPKLNVFAAGRSDLIAMKFIAHRPQDLEDLDDLAVTADDKEFVKTYLVRLSTKGTAVQDVTEATEILNSWPISK